MTPSPGETVGSSAGYRHKSEKAQLKFEGKRERVLASALELFIENGYDATSLQQIADRSGLLKGSLYYYWRTKEDLLYAVVERVHQSTQEMLDEISAEGRSPCEQIESILRLCAAGAVRDRKLLVVFYREMNRIPEQRRSAIVALRDRQDAILRDLIVAGQERGAIERSLDPKITSMSLSLLANSPYTWYRPDGPLPLETIIDQVVGLAMNSLRTHGA